MLTAASVTPASRSAGTWARRIGSSPWAMCSAASALQPPAAEFGTAHGRYHGIQLTPQVYPRR